MADSNNGSEKEDGKKVMTPYVKLMMLGCGAVLFIIIALILLIFVFGNLNTFSNK